MLGVGLRLGLTWRRALLLLAPLVAVELLLRLWVSRRVPRFERELMGLLQSGRAEEALGLASRQPLLRLAGPSYLLQGKLALIYRQLGRTADAAAALRQALTDAPSASRFSLSVGLADCLYLLGEDGEAERVYRASLAERNATASPGTNLARLILKRGGDPDEAERYLLRAAEWERDGTARVELIQLALSRGKISDAEWHLQLLTETRAAVQPEDEQLRALRLSVEAARAAALSDDSDAPPPVSAPGPTSR